MPEYRIETDTLGSKKIPHNVYYGIQTQRAVENFPVSGLREDAAFIRAYLTLKKAAAIANNRTGKLDNNRMKLIVRAVDMLLGGGYWDQFVVDVYQAGAGTSFNMNVNEVITNCALKSRGRRMGDYSFLNPNDHVNMSQSTNDTFPAAMQMASLARCGELIQILKNLKDGFSGKAIEFGSIKKSGRTHLQDAVGIFLGDEFAAFASAVDGCIGTLKHAGKELEILPIGGTAVGNGVNTPRRYRRDIFKALNELTGLRFRLARNTMYALHGCHPMLGISGALKSLAVQLIKIANDLRLLSSGPTTGLNEIVLPAVQPGSSIMPGKVNPVMAECLNMICFQVIGSDTAVTMAVQAGQLELNVMMPLMIHSVMHSFAILINYLPVFNEKCIRGIMANEERCRAYHDNNPIQATLFAPVIGYKKAAEVVKKAMKEGKSIREVLLEENLLPAEEIRKLLR